MYFQYKPVSQFLESLLFIQNESYVFSIFFFVDVFFGYMSLVSCYSLFSIEIFGFYGFYPGQTHPITFLTFVYYMSKLTYPLCYTTLYILLGNSDRLARTSFYQSIGNLSVIPILGYDLPKYLPFLFLALLLLFLTDCFTHMLRALGFRFYDFKDQECEQVEDGKRIATEYANLFYEELLEKEIEQNKRNKKVLNYEDLVSSALRPFDKPETGSRGSHKDNTDDNIELFMGMPESRVDARLL